MKIRRILRATVIAGAALALVATGQPAQAAKCTNHAEAWALYANLHDIYVGPLPYAAFPAGPAKGQIAATAHLPFLKAGAITATASGDKGQAYTQASASIADVGIDIPGVITLKAGAIKSWCKTSTRKDKKTGKIVGTVSGASDLDNVVFKIGGRSIVDFHKRINFRVDIPGGLGYVELNHRETLRDGTYVVRAIDIRLSKAGAALIQGGLELELGTSVCRHKDASQTVSVIPTPSGHAGHAGATKPGHGAH